MKTDIFPINYFKSVWTPIQAFKNRHKLNGFQLILVLVFLNGLMTIPVTLNYATLDFMPLEEFYPNAVKIIDEKAMEVIQTNRFDNGQMFIETPFHVENDYGVVAGHGEASAGEELEDVDRYIYFEENQFLINEEGSPLTSVLYTKDFRLDDLESVEEIRHELSRQWFNQNRIFIVLFFSLMISAFMFIMTLFVVLGSAFLLYLTKKSTVTAINTYKESVNLVLNSLTLPTVVAMIMGVLHFDVTIMATIQTVGLIVMLFVIYYKTYFNDDRLTRA